METTPEQTAEGLLIVRVLSSVLDRLVCANTAVARADPGQITKFHAMKAPAIGIQQYLERIHKYASCSNECFILALIYIDRLIQRNNFLLTELNVHRVVITTILLAAKFFDDAYYNNAYYAKVGGVLTSEMNGLEVDFLFRINFSLHVSSDVFQKYRAELVSQASGLTVPVSLIATPAVLAQPPPTVVPSPSTVLQVPALQYAEQGLEFHDHSRNYMAATVPIPQATATHRPCQITPSPPNDAGRILNDILLATARNSSTNSIAAAAEQTLPIDYFVPRPTPLDPLKSNLLRQPLISHRCAAQKALAAAAAMPSMGNGLSFTSHSCDDPFLVMEHQLFANATNTVSATATANPGALLQHFHHPGEFATHLPAEAAIDYGLHDAQQLLSNRMLAGLGAGV